MFQCQQAFDQLALAAGVGLDFPLAGRREIGIQCRGGCKRVEFFWSGCGLFELLGREAEERDNAGGVFAFIQRIAKFSERLIFRHRSLREGIGVQCAVLRGEQPADGKEHHRQHPMNNEVVQ